MGKLDEMLVEVQPKGTFKDGDDRYYEVGDCNYPSVTTLISKLPNYWIANWYRKLITEQAMVEVQRVLDNANVPQNMRGFFSDMGDAKENLKHIPTKKGKDAASLGTIAHAAIHAALEDGDKPDIFNAGYVKAAKGFLKYHELTPFMLEAQMANENYSYAGTADAICKYPHGGHVVVDWKTGARIYPSAALQVIALAECNIVKMPNDKWANTPDIPEAMVVNLNDDGSWSSYTVNQDNWSQMFEIFLALRKVIDWEKYKQSDLWEDVIKNQNN